MLLRSAERHRTLLQKILQISTCVFNIETYSAEKKQHLVSEMLFEEACNNGSGSGSTLVLSQQHGKPVLIDMRPKSRNNEISVDAML